MFAHFEKVFNNDIIGTVPEIPENLIKYYNKSLPEGLEYRKIDKNSIAISSASDEFRMSGFIIKFDKEDKEINKTSSITDIHKYIYNAQKRLEIIPKEKGQIVMNGQKVNLSQIVKTPFSGTTILPDTHKFYIIPNAFPKPHKITLADDMYTIDLTVHRIANKSINEIAFESERDKPIYVKYFFNEVDEPNFKLSVILNLETANTVKEIVKSISIYNSFLQNKMTFCGIPSQRFSFAQETKKFDIKTLNTWKKLLELEEVLNVNFVPQTHELSEENLIDIYILYYNLVKKEPLRSYYNIDSIDVNSNNITYMSTEDIINKDICMTFKCTKDYNLLGQKFTLSCLIGMFDTKVSEIKENNGIKTLFFNDRNQNSKYYTVELNYIESSKGEISINNRELVDLLQNAKKATDYLAKENI